LYFGNHRPVFENNIDFGFCFSKIDFWFQKKCILFSDSDLENRCSNFGFRNYWVSFLENSKFIMSRSLVSEFFLYKFKIIFVELILNFEKTNHTNRFRVSFLGNQISLLSSRMF